MELKNDDDSRFGRSLKAAFIGGLWGGGVVMVIRYCFNWTIGAADVIPGAVSGTLVAVIPTTLLPRGFSLPKDLTAITYRSIGAFCLWVVADGIAKGKIHNVPGRYKGRSFMNLTSWSESPPVGFWLNVLMWGVIGCAMLI